MYPDFKDLLSEFNAHRVKYLVIGGYALALHAEPRGTKDLDIFIGPEPENARAVWAALSKFGAPGIERLTAADLVEPGSFFRMGTPPAMVDILSRISGVEFEAAWGRRVTAVVDDNLSVPVISRDDLLAAKLAAGRAQDLADAAVLKEAQTLQMGLGQIDEMQRTAAERWRQAEPQTAGRGKSNEFAPDATPKRSYGVDDD